MAGRHYRDRGGDTFQYRAPEPTIRSHRARRQSRRPPRTRRRHLTLGLILSLTTLAGGITVVAYGHHWLTTGSPPRAAASRSCLQNTHTATGAGFVVDTGNYTTLRGPNASDDTVAMGVDAAGQVVGGYTSKDGKTHGFLWKDRSYQTLDAPHANDTTLIRINDQGQLLGVYDDDQHACHSFLLQHGQFTAIQVNGDPTEALDLNNHGVITGNYLSRDGKLHGFLLNDGHVTTIDVPGAVETGATSVNDDGVVVGYYLDTQHKVHGYLREHDGLLTDINVPGAEGFTLPFAVAAAEQTVGEFVGADAVHGFRTDGDRYTSIDAPGTGTVNQVFDLNNGGTIVGYSGRYVSDSTPDPNRAANDILDLWLA